MDSGNIKQIRHISKNHFILQIGSDPQNKTETKIYKNWFYFSIKGFQKDNHQIKFTINNMKFNWSMWKHGFTPVFRSKINTKNKWKLFDKSKVRIYLKKKKLSLEFKYKFQKNEHVDFALTFPYTISNYNEFGKHLEKNFEKN